ncbi:MAG: hypothetical protein EBS90_14095, partial [Betaproteobacteria bacterium]|nr:hypothetical protein [Betaproteobacteria bacterium]
DDAQDAVHNPSILRPRLTRAAEWLRANGAYLRLLAQCLQLLFPEKFPENAYANPETRDESLRDILLIIVARDLYRPDGQETRALGTPAPDWLEHAEWPEADAWPSWDALEGCWYEAFKRIRTFWQEHKDAVKAWASAEPDRANPERGERVGTLPKGRPRRCGKKPSAADRQWCFTCRVLIVINACLFRFEHPKFKECNVRGFFLQNRAIPRRDAPNIQERDRMPQPTVGENLKSLMAYSHSVSIHLGTGRILTAAWVPSVYTRKRTVQDLLRAKYPSVPAEAWENMELKGAGAGILKKRLDDFDSSPADVSLRPERVGIANDAEAQDVVWYTPSKTETLG